MRQLKIATLITNRDSPSLERYLAEISKTNLLAPEEEVELSEKIKAGDQQALTKLIKANLRFVVSVAKQYQKQGLPLLDLINEGNIGLTKAAQRFDASKGFKFISYAVWWIRQSILQGLAEQAKLVRLPMNKVGLKDKAKKTTLAFIQEHEREPSAEELAELLDSYKQHDIEIAVQHDMRHSSLDAAINQGGEDEITLLDKIPDKESPPDDFLSTQESLSTSIESALAILSDNHLFVIRAFYGIGMEPLSLDSIGKKLKMTPAGASQLKQKALLKLQRSANVKSSLKQYLG